MIKLFEVPNNTWIDVSHLGLIDSVNNDHINKLFFKHIDGMYSFCLTEHNKVVHLKAWTEVKILN